MVLLELCLRKDAEPDAGALVKKLHSSKWEKKGASSWLWLLLMKTKKVAPEKLTREVLSTGPEGKQGTHFGGLTH